MSQQGFLRSLRNICNDPSPANLRIAPQRTVSASCIAPPRRSPSSLIWTSAWVARLCPKNPRQRRRRPLSPRLLPRRLWKLLIPRQQLGWMCPHRKQKARQRGVQRQRCTPRSLSYSPLLHHRNNCINKVGWGEGGHRRGRVLCNRRMQRVIIKV